LRTAFVEEWLGGEARDQESHPQEPVIGQTVIGGQTPLRHASSSCWLLNRNLKQPMKTIAAPIICLMLFVRSLAAAPLQEQNKAIAKLAFREILSKGNFALAGQVYAKDFVNHGIDRDSTLDEDQAALVGWHQAFPNVVAELRKLIAEDDLVTVYWVARGTNTGTGNGLPATGKKVELAGITIWRIVDGKIKEEWSTFDYLSLMQQLGLIPSETK
jgi:steroid delta-isomerase-like uncharacterized protein